MSGNVPALQYEWQHISAEERAPSGTVSFTAIDKVSCFLVYYFLNRLLKSETPWRASPRGGSSQQLTKCRLYLHLLSRLSIVGSCPEST